MAKIFLNMKITVLFLVFIHSYVAFSQKPVVRKYYTADILLNKLNTYHSDTIERIGASQFNDKINVNSDVRKKLLSLLKNEWSDTEIAIKVNNDFQKNFPNYFKNKLIFGLKRSISDTAKKKGIPYESIYIKVYDSIANLYKIEAKKRILESPVPDEIVKSAATSNIREAIKVIQDDLANKDKHYFNKQTAELALARLGIRSFQEKFYNLHSSYLNSEKDRDNLRYDDFDNLSFIHTQHGILLLNDWLDTTRTYMYRGKIRYYCDEFLLIISSSILNKDFHDYLINTDLASPWDVTKEMITNCKEWLVKNVGKYELY